MVDHHQYVVEHLIPIHHAIKMNRFRMKIIYYLLVLNRLFEVLHEYSLENKQPDFEYDLKKNRNRFELIFQTKTKFN
jgi:hypothetical protein